MKHLGRSSCKDVLFLNQQMGILKGSERTSSKCSSEIGPPCVCLQLGLKLDSSRRGPKKAPNSEAPIQHERGGILIAVLHQISSQQNSDLVWSSLSST